MTDDPKALIAEARKIADASHHTGYMRDMIRRLADALERELARPINVTLASDNDVVRLPGITLGPVTRS